MTPNAQHKRAERERRKAAGEVRCEVWLDADTQQCLAMQMAMDQAPREVVIAYAIRRLAGYYNP